MKNNKIIHSLLISMLFLGGLGLASTQANASQIHHYHPRINRIKSSAKPNFRKRRIHLKKPVNQSKPTTLKRAHHQNQTVHNRQHKRTVNVSYRKSKPRKKVTHSFTTVNNHTRDLNNDSWESFGNGHRETVKSYSGPRLTLKTLRFLPQLIGTHFIQSIAVTPSGHYAYVGCDAYPYLSGYTKIAEVNLRKRVGGIKVGPRFYGGHGQALSYSPKNQQLWLLVDPSGPLHRGTFDEISTRSLKPIRRVRFKNHKGDLGDVLAFDNQGNAYNENRIWSWDTTRQFKQGMILLYKGKLNRHQAKFNLIKQGIRRAPGYIIQGIAYNNHTHRLYIETDDAIMSVPINKLGQLKSKDVKETILHGHREYEGISFDRHGHAYVVMARPTEILKSTRVF